MSERVGTTYRSLIKRVEKNAQKILYHQENRCLFTKNQNFLNWSAMTPDIFFTGTRYVFDYESQCLWIEVSVNSRDVKISRFAPVEKIPRASACIAARPCLSCGRKSDKFILQNIMIYENILQKTTPMNQSNN